MNKFAPKRSKLDELRSYRYWILIIVLLSSVAAVIYNKKRPPLYTSEAVLFVDRRSTVEDVSPIAIPDMTPDVVKTSYLARSKYMWDHVAKRFELYHYFNIPKNDPLKRERLYKVLDKRVAVKITDKRAVSITVADRRPEMAMTIANGIANHLLELVNRETVRESNRIKKVYAKVLENSQKRLDAQTAELREIVQEHPQIWARAETGDPVLVKLSDLMVKINATNDRMQATNEYYSVLKALSKQETPPHIKIVKRAVKDIKTSPTWLVITRILSTCFISVFVFVTLLMLRHEYYPDLMNAITKVPDEDPEMLNGRNGRPQEYAIDGPEVQVTSKTASRS